MFGAKITFSSSFLFGVVVNIHMRMSDVIVISCHKHTHKHTNESLDPLTVTYNNNRDRNFVTFLFPVQKKTPLAVVDFIIMCTVQN